MKTAGQFLAQSNQKLYFVAPTATVRDALEIMATHNIGALLVLEEQALKGIFSERDYARKVVLKGKSSSEAFVLDIMTHKVITIETHQSIHDCMQIMTDFHIRHLPIMNGKEVLGLISIGDVVREMMEYQEEMIKQLKNYIAG
jgi:CBS domain-containing protein